MAEDMLRFLLRRFFQRRDLERELNDERASHTAMKTARHVQDGESPDAARQIALREFGNMGLVAEVTRDQWGLGWLERALGEPRVLGKNRFPLRRQQGKPSYGARRKDPHSSLARRAPSDFWVTRGRGHASIHRLPGY